MPPRRRKAIAACLTAACLLLPTACDTGTPAGSATVLAPQCPEPPPGLQVSVRELNAFVANADLDLWQAGDIGASARLSDDRLVWVFGDTVRPVGVEPRIVANSMLVSSGVCVGQVVPADSGPVIPDARAGVVRWPMSVVVLRGSDADTIVVFCSRIRRDDVGTFDFSYLGSSLAVFTVRPGGSPTLQDVLDITPDAEDPFQVNWGAAATLEDGWFYVYGTRVTGAPYVTGRELYVARAPASAFRERGSWRFWDGTTWQADPASAIAVLPAEDGVSQTLSVHAVDGSFVAVSKRGGDVGDFVYVWTAPGPTGPWTATRAVEAPAGFDSGRLQYAPLAHPEVRLRSGGLLVSISRNTTDLGALLRDPRIGRPQFVQVARP